MATNEDARPFVDLQKDSEEFVAKFEEDIAEFKTVLNSKITSLICDPDSFGNAGNYEKNPLVEFSKAKYTIFISMKSLVNEREKEWIKYLAEMKKLFLENVEIFLAGTKLEVKLPSSEYQSISDTKKSPGNKKSSIVPSSLYPMISNFTKNIPAFSSSLQSKDVYSSEPEETRTMVSPRNRSFESKMDIDQVEIDLNTSQSSSRSRRSAKLNTSDLNVSWTLSKGKGKLKETSELNNHNQVLHSEDMKTEEEVIGKPIISKLQGRKNKSQSAILNKKSKGKGILKKVSSSESQEEASELESGVQVSSSESQEDDDFKSEKESSELLKGRGRRGKKPAGDKMIGKITTSEESEETSEVEQRSSRIKSRKSIRGTSRNNKTVSDQSSEENEKLQETVINTNIPPVKGRRGKQLKSKEKENVFKLENQVDEAVQEEELNPSSDIPRTRKGRSAAAKSFVKPSDPPLVSNTRRGRSTTKEEGKATRISRKLIDRKTLNERISESDTSVSPVRTILPVEEDINDDLDIYNPVAKSTKSSARRKTLLPNINEPSSGVTDTLKGNSTRSRSKRKTIGGVSDLASVAPSKRLKVSSSQMSDAIIEDKGAVGDDNLLDKNDSYSDWIVLKNMDGKIPSTPAIYEVKVWRAKKTAYIGSCESLRQMLTLHKLKQNSGHKHLDKFIERNYNDIQVRYELTASLNDAKVEVKNRINDFVAQHKTTPAYN